MNDLNSNKHLAWFLGPKGENSRYFEEIFADILKDYVHWRKNYFPEDNLLLSKSDQKEEIFAMEIDALYQKVYEMMGHLKRNFPFYSPRYMGHMLSDITMPSMLGYFAGMLFNANNVTSEASPVAVEWEIEASNALIKMIGYNRSPKPPYSKDLDKVKMDEKVWKDLYTELTSAEYAWGHITSGGTIANIEALWVARSVKYQALGIVEAYVRIKAGVDWYDVDKTVGILTVKKIVEFEGIQNTDYSAWLNGSELREKDDLRILNLKTQDALNLLQNFYNSIGFIDEDRILLKIQNVIQKNFPEITSEDIEKRKNQEFSNLKIKAGVHLLTKTRYYTDLPDLMSKYSPLIFAPSTAHYSIQKAADLLAIPRSNVIKVPVDSKFRMDTDALKNLIDKLILDNNAESLVKGTRKFKIPLVVIGVCGTTEEGAVDPIHKIINLRKKYEAESNQSFWVHADAAYGGFFTSLIRIHDKDFINFFKRDITNFIDKVIEGYARLSAESMPTEDLKGRNHNQVYEDELRNVKLEIVQEFEESLDHDIANRIYFEPNSLNFNFGSYALWFFSIREKYSVKQNMKKIFQIVSLENRIIRDKDEKDKDYSDVLDLIYDIIKVFGNTKYYSQHYRWVEDEFRYNIINEKITSKEFHDSRTGEKYNWAEMDVFKSFKTICEADSVTIDPHKMGYVQYPSGFVAFKSDKVRNYIKQGAPYITSSGSNILNFHPPRHLEDLDIAMLEKGLFPYHEEKHYKVAIDAFAPYMLEGSKPAAAAASLWLTTNLIKPNIDNYGKIIINSIRSANELYHGIEDWDNLKNNRTNAGTGYKIVNLTGTKPDTNVIVFFIKPLDDKSNRVITLELINKATIHVYRKFHISAEHGDRKTSYSQEFFISKTVMDSNTYDYDCLSLHTKAGMSFDYDGFKSDYDSQGLEILRMTMMNPYIYAYKDKNRLNLIDKFLKEVDEAMKTFEFAD